MSTNFLRRRSPRILRWRSGYPRRVSDTAQRMVWVDLEMTGLDPATCVIVEIATIVTDADLAIVAEGPNLVIHQSDEALASMNPYVRELHTRSGLLERIRTSTISNDDAKAETLRFVEQHCPKGNCVLAGNSVWKDKQFLEKYMPELTSWLHYRLVDVSTIKEIVRRWYPSSFHAPKKKEIHRALDDIRESIEELKWYRQQVFRDPNAPRA
jgi:oligoribonuclease